MSIAIQECMTCLTRYFPQRLLCRTCLAHYFRAVKVDQGHVEEQTTLANGFVLASIRIDHNVRVVGKVHSVTRPGDVVELIDHESIDPGQAYIPTRKPPQ